jgi:hypothetical protein
VYVWAGFAVAGTIKPAWAWFQRNRVAGWPIADGRITSTGISQPTALFGWKQPSYSAELDYSYTIAGEDHSGTHTRECSTEQEAEECIRDLENKAVVVHVNPSAPDRSGLLEADIRELLQNRAPALVEAATVALPLGHSWLVFFEALSCIGLFLSLWVHVGALLGKHVAPTSFFFCLHVGIFVVWFPAVVVAKRLVGSANRKDFWKVVLKGAPEWMRYMCYVFMGYAVINFLLFMTQAPLGSGGGTPTTIEWRGFSGHWMAFYSAAFAILYSAAAQSRGWRECPNGHRTSRGSPCCRECGLPIDHRV